MDVHFITNSDSKNSYAVEYRRLVVVRVFRDEVRSLEQNNLYCSDYIVSIRN